MIYHAFNDRLHGDNLGVTAEGLHRSKAVTANTKWRRPVRSDDSRDAASNEAKGWTFLNDTKYVMKWGMSDAERLACIRNRRTPLMLND